MPKLRVVYLRTKVMSYLIAGIIGLIISIALWPWVNVFDLQYAPVFAVKQGQNLGPLLIALEKTENPGSMFWMLVLKAALPSYAAPGEQHYLLELAAYLANMARTTEPHRILAQGITGLSTITFMPASPIITTSPDIVSEVPDIPSAPPATNHRPMIVMYHSHNSESFVPTTGMEHVYNNPDKSIIAVGLELAKELQALGAAVVHSAEDHVRQAHDQSYSRSLETITSILNTYPNVDYVLDIHRDGVSRSLTTLTMNGYAVARVEIVIGTNEALGHYNWRENYAFAQKLHNKLEEMYPGFSRGILLRSLSRFNQHVHPKSVLIEIGGHENSMEEAIRATKYLAEVIMALGE